MQEDLLEAFRTPLFFVYISMLLSFCMVSGSQLGDRVELEFQAYRLQQYDVANNVIGSKSFRVMYEAVGIDSNALRKCMVVSWRDLWNRDLEGMFNAAVGAVIIVLPPDFSMLAPNERKHLLDLETALSMVQTEMSVYAIKYTDAASALLSDVSFTSTESTATQKLIQTVSANTFQLTSTTTSIPTSLPYTPKNVIVRLGGASSTAPTIVFVAHYDTHSAFPDLGAGADSNGSGVVALLELLSVFKRFYDRAATKPNHHMIFVWSAAGKHNYQGSTAFVAEMQEKYSDERIDLAICLDTIGNGKALNVHLSKAPAPGSTSDRFVTHLRAAAHNQTIEVAAKKINLNIPLSWEHERFNAKRQPALTLSSLSVPSEMTRRSISDYYINSAVLTRNTRTIAEAVLAMILPLPERSAHKDDRVSSDSTLLAPEAVSKKRIEQLITRFASHARPLSSQSSSEETVSNLLAFASSYGHARTQPVTLDTVVVPSAIERIVAEKTKPAVFDLLLAAGIAAYLALLMKIVSCSQSILDGALTSLRKGY
ncbi:hypothetical protein PFISCL1PPCAC_19333 [Pristionchus fissidentatus]|uniref:BOS complex subunit NCLN n=1 Tax=Pristionchus fissidentatus TaxID=1538716 RepID=A0AAV5W775_9BILA|nr:hypothetical protein PFISCL1PPCAC_19333 [Pristionchus fissidentatus]